MAAVFVALVRVYERDGRATVRAVGTEAGLSSTSTTWFHLRALRSRGMVTWDKGTTGTLRPLFTVVAASPI